MKILTIFMFIILFSTVSKADPASDILSQRYQELDNDSSNQNNQGFKKDIDNQVKNDTIKKEDNQFAPYINDKSRISEYNPYTGRLTSCANNNCLAYPVYQSLEALYNNGSNLSKDYYYYIKHRDDDLNIHGMITPIALQIKQSITIQGQEEAVLVNYGEWEYSDSNGNYQNSNGYNFIIIGMSGLSDQNILQNLLLKYVGNITYNNALGSTNTVAAFKLVKYLQ